MLTLFPITSGTVPVNSGSLVSPRHEYVVNRFEESLVRSAYNYRKTPYFVESDHILIKILHAVGIPYEGDDATFYTKVAARTTAIARAVGFNDINAKVGASRKNSFFSDAIGEVVVSYSKGYSPDMSVAGAWAGYRPVNVLYHPYNDLTMNIRNGANDIKDIYGHAVITVDIPLLMLQFHKWKLWARKTYDVLPNIAQFVFQFPLVGVLFSDLDVSYLNQIHSYSIGLPIVPQKKRYTFSLPDTNNFVREDIEWMLDMIQKKKRSVASLGHALPLIVNKTFLNFIEGPKILVTANNAGALSLGMFPWIALLAQLSFQSSSQDNGAMRNFIHRFFNSCKSSGAYRNLPGFGDSYIEDYYEEQIKPYL